MMCCTAVSLQIILVTMERMDMLSEFCYVCVCNTLSITIA